MRWIAGALGLLAAITASAFEMSLDPVDWDVYGKPGTPTVASTADGLKVNSGGYRASTELIPALMTDLSETTTYIKWQAHGGNSNEYAWWTIGPAKEETSATYDLTFYGVYSRLSTHHSWSGSVVIPEDEWIYTRVSVSESAGEVAVVTALGNFDDMGGTVQQERLGHPTDWDPYDDMNVGLRVQDNYGSTATYLLVGEMTMIPEPTSLLFLALGALTLLRRRRS